MTDWSEPTDLEVLLLERYCSGSATADDMAHIEAWFRAHPEQRTWYEQFRGELRQRIALPLSTEQRSAALADLMRVALERRPGVLGASGAAHSARGAGRPLPQRVWSFAVAVALGLIVMVVGWHAGARHVIQRDAASMLTYATGNGERATITLPDGGTVALNVASRLEVPLDYMTGNRTVRLTGEGLFTVVHHPETPLTVLAGTTAARVLGTSFVVRRYATDTATMVAVRDGKVAVGSTIVTAAHMVDVGRTGVAVVRPSDLSLFSFATGTLTLSGLSLPAAIAELDRWYDVDIRLGSPALATHKLRGEFTAGSLGDLAEDLEFTLSVRVVRDGRVLTLYPR